MRKMTPVIASFGLYPDPLLAYANTFVQVATSISYVQLFADHYGDHVPRFILLLHATL